MTCKCCALNERGRIWPAAPQQCTHCCANCHEPWLMFKHLLVTSLIIIAYVIWSLLVCHTTLEGLRWSRSYAGWTDHDSGG